MLALGSNFLSFYLVINKATITRGKMIWISSNWFFGVSMGSLFKVFWCPFNSIMVQLSKTIPLGLNANCLCVLQYPVLYRFKM